MFHSIRSRTMLGTLLPALIALAVSLFAARAFGVAAGIVAGVLTAVAAAWLAADRLHRPLRLLQIWLLNPTERALRLEAGGEWDAVANALTAMMIDAWRRASVSETELVRLRTVLANMADGVVVADSGARLLLMNPAARDLFSVSPPAVGVGVLQATGSADLDRTIREVLASGTTRTVDLDAGMGRRRVRALVSTSRDGGTRHAAVAVLHDITETLRLDTMRRDFVSNVSHELRTPVASIRMMTDALRSGALDNREDAVRFVDHTHEAAGRLTELIDDLLALARAESGSPRDLAEVPVAPVIRMAAAALDPVISRKRLDLELSVAEDLKVWADVEILRQITGNLLENAVKYTPDDGHIAVSAAWAEDSVRLDVTDTGIGIPPDDVGRVFERFFRVDRARSREAGGTGLGLSIVKHLVEELGGKVDVRSELGRGSTFTVTVPRAPSNH